MECKVEELEFVKLKIPRLIPKELVDSVKGRTFSVEQFYMYQEQQVDNPFNFLYALVDEDKKIWGYLWAEQNALDQSLFVNTYSVDKRYWGGGKAIPIAIGFLEGLVDRTRAPRCFWVTTNEKYFLKHGFKRSRQSLMEYII